MAPAIIADGRDEPQPRGLLIIDSHSSAFQHLRWRAWYAPRYLSGVVPPQELVVIRDRSTGEIADSHSFDKGRIYESRELFVDGGVFPTSRPGRSSISPARRCGRLVRHQQLRRPRGPPLRASAYGRWCISACRCSGSHPCPRHAAPARPWAPNCGRGILVHSDKAMNLPAGYWRALFSWRPAAVGRISKAF